MTLFTEWTELLHAEWTKEFKFCSSSVLCSGVLQALLWMMLVRNVLLYAIMCPVQVLHGWYFCFIQLLRIEFWSCDKGSLMGFYILVFF